MILLQKIYDISKDENGRIFAWRGTTIAEFKNPLKFKEYIDSHLDLKRDEVRAFTGSASTIADCNAYLDEVLR